MYSFFSFNLMCICEHIPCSWLVDFFVLLVIGEKVSTNNVLNIEILQPIEPSFKNLLSHALDVFRCALV
jgi:hypothetical protein